MWEVLSSEPGGTEVPSLRAHRGLEPHGLQLQLGWRSLELWGGISVFPDAPGRRLDACSQQHLYLPVLTIGNPMERLWVQSLHGPFASELDGPCASPPPRNSLWICETDEGTWGGQSNMDCCMFGSIKAVCCNLNFIPFMDTRSDKSLSGWWFLVSRSLSTADAHHRYFSRNWDFLVKETYLQLFLFIYCWS